MRHGTVHVITEASAVEQRVLQQTIAILRDMGIYQLTVQVESESNVRSR